MTNSSRSTPNVSEHAKRSGEVYWFAREHKSIIFLIVTLALVGAYLAFSIPIAVFPTTDFPRVLIGVDNGVMPIDQMLVTITRPIEEAVRGVQGIEDVRSITSRGSAEIDLYFSWRVDMFQTSATRQCRSRARAIHSAAHGADHHRSIGIFKFPDPRVWTDFGQNFAGAIVGNRDLRHEAASGKPFRSFHHPGAGRRGSGISHRAGSLQSCARPASASRTFLEPWINPTSFSRRDFSRAITSCILA